jgi:OmpA-OmpF porin, OOP family
MKLAAFLFLGMGVIFPALHAQPNLVRNGDFSEIHRCPGAHNEGRSRQVAPGWVSPSRGTPDLYHTCSQREAGVPSNWAGHASPKAGKGYAGLYMWWDKTSEYREYLQTELLESLVAGQEYEVSYYIRLANYCRYAIDRMGMSLTTQADHWMHDKRYPDTDWQQVVFPSALSVGSEEWVRVEWTYVARGGEKFLTIGNFATNQDTRAQRLTHRTNVHKMLEQSAYYFVDGVEVKALPGPEQMRAWELFGEWPQPGQSYVFQNIHFAFDKANILPSSLPVLEELAEWLRQHPHAVEVVGHTDDQGSEAYNEDLSRRRAEAVVQFLVEKGVASAMLSSRGMGKSQPLVHEVTEEARQANRRVEFYFLEGG